MTAKHFVSFFLEAHNTFKMLHWFTSSYAVHVALDKLVDSFQSLSDKFVEVYIGKHGRNSAALRNNQVGNNIMTDASAAKNVSTVLDECIRYCVTDLNKYISTKDTDLANIRDELVATLNQTKYLISLR
jgi:hypothetical protein